MSQPEPTGKSHLAIVCWVLFPGSKSDQGTFSSVLDNFHMSYSLFIFFSAEVEIATHTTAEIVTLQKPGTLDCLVISGIKK